MLDLRTVYQWLPNVTMFGSGAERFTGISTDSRTVCPGDLYIALRGDRFDGHAFIDAAIDAGAAAVLTEVFPERVRVPTLWVPDTRRALGALAGGWRRRFQCPLIAVTGSNGKTTVKEMIAAILVAHLGAKAAFATRGNFNNDIGVPLTLLRLSDAHRMGVVEMGMNHPGEIAGLAAMTQPSVALVLNAQREHQEFMDGPEATARENGTVFGALAAGGVAVFPGDDPCTPIWQALAQGHCVLNFGLVADEVALQADAQSMADAGTPHLSVAAARDARPEHFRVRLGKTIVDIRLNIAGRHNVRNALAAAACTLAQGVPVEAIVRGLAAFEPVNGRLRRTHTAQGVPLIDDTYNANPDSMRAAIDVLADQPAPRLMVMGDMGETGAQAEAFHREVGEYAVSRAIEQVWAVGKDMKAAVQAGGVQHWETIEALLTEHPQAPAGIASILVKGSRFMKMERVVRAWADVALLQGEH